MPYLAHHNSLSERNVDSASQGQVYDCVNWNILLPVFVQFLLSVMIEII